MAYRLTSALHKYAHRWISVKNIFEQLKFKRIYATVAELMRVPAFTPATSVDIAGTRALLFCNKENGLTKLVKLSLRERGVHVTVEEIESSEIMIEKAQSVEHDIIICPFLTKRVPKEVWQNKDKPCLIVHPGIPGDRGMSSLDWAILEQKKCWGVSVVQAVEEMDNGDIWSTVEFPVRETLTKSTLYNSQVADAAISAVLEAIERFTLKIPPMPLNYGNPLIKGTLKPKMRVKDRKLHWGWPAEDIARRVRMSDTQPGSQGRLHNLGMEAVLFGAHVQPSHQTQEVAQVLGVGSPGDVVAQKDGSVLVKAADGNGVWISHMKSGPGKEFLKLPSMNVLPKEGSQLPVLKGPTSWQEITTSRVCGDPRLAMVHFDFYNGAMSTEQCQRLRREIELVSQDPIVKVIVLLGGAQFFSNGIHLNVIEAAEDPVEESWSNINAIDDVIKSFVTLESKVIVSALQSGAGAGGVMMAAAADLVWARQGILLTPTYKAMHLFGSEYWTYFLPNRVGPLVAEQLTSSTETISIQTAESLGLIDKTFGRNSEEFLHLLPSHLFNLLASGLCNTILEGKLQRGPAFLWKLENHRVAELEKINRSFRSPAYHDARKAFVYH